MLHEVSLPEQKYLEAYTQLKQWRDQFSAAMTFRRPGELGKYNPYSNLDYARQPFEMLDAILQQLPSEAQTHQMSLFGHTFESKPITHQGLSSVIITPSGRDSYAIPTWYTDLHREYLQSISTLKEITEYRDKLPLIINIYLPSNFKWKDEDPMKYFGWIQDFGPLLIHTYAAADGLVARKEGNAIHEAYHALMGIRNPDVYAAAIKPYPHLDEALAITTELAMYSHQAIPSGMVASYFHTLRADQLLTLDQLNGGGVFNHELYNQRAALATMTYLCLLGVERCQEDDQNRKVASIKDLLYVGLKTLEDDSRLEDRSKNVVKRIFEAAEGSKGDRLNHESIWNELLREVLPYQSNYTIYERMNDTFISNVHLVRLFLAIHPHSNKAGFSRIGLLLHPNRIDMPRYMDPPLSKLSSEIFGRRKISEDIFI